MSYAVSSRANTFDVGVKKTKKNTPKNRTFLARLRF